MCLLVFGIDFFYVVTETSRVEMLYSNKYMLFFTSPDDLSFLIFLLYYVGGQCTICDGSLFAFLYI